MRSLILKYKNFVGSVEYSDTDKILFGKVQGMGELISYKGKTIKEIIKKAGSWYSYNETKLGQGKDAVKLILKVHPRNLP